MTSKWSDIRRAKGAPEFGTPEHEADRKRVRAEVEEARVSRKRKVFFECYQLAGPLLLAPDLYTEGQRERLANLLLNVLFEPERYTPKLVRTLRDLAVKP